MGSRLPSREVVLNGELDEKDEECADPPGVPKGSSDEYVRRDMLPGQGREDRQNAIEDQSSAIQRNEAP